MGFSEIGVCSAIIGVSKNWGWGSENAHTCFMEYSIKVGQDRQILPEMNDAVSKLSRTAILQLLLAPYFS